VLAMLMALSAGVVSALMDKAVALPLVACTDVGTAPVGSTLVADKVTLEPPVRGKVMPVDDATCMLEAELESSELTGIGLM